MRAEHRSLLLASLTAMSTVFLAPRLADAATFQEEVDRVCGGESDACGGPINAAAGPGGQPSVTEPSSAAARLAIERRLRQLECPEGDCPEESASADTLGGGLGLFGSVDYENKDRDETDFESGYESDRLTGTIGLDYQMSSISVVGVALSYGHTDGDFDNDGGDFDKDSFGANVYASLFPADNVFVDVILGYTRSNYEYTRTVVVGGLPFGDAEGDTDEDEFTASVTGGYDFYFGPVTVGPRVGLAYKFTRLDEYSESSGNTQAELEYESQSETSFTSSIGGQASYALSTGFGVVVPQVNAAWVHEFANAAQDVDATFIDLVPPEPIEYRTDKPDRDYFNLGVSVTTLLPNGWAPFASYSAQLGNSLETTHGVAVGLRLEL